MMTQQHPDPLLLLLRIIIFRSVLFLIFYGLDSYRMGVPARRPVLVSYSFLYSTRTSMPVRVSIDYRMSAALRRAVSSISADESFELFSIFNPLFETFFFLASLVVSYEYEYYGYSL